MKKFLSPFFIVLLCLNFSFIYAQTKHAAKAIQAKPFTLNQNLFSKTPGAVCDTVNLQTSYNWTPLVYTYGNQGYVFGTVDTTDFDFKFLEQANYFDVSAYDYNYISGGLIYFAYANSNVAADLNKNIIFKLYDDAGGYPGNLLASTTLSLKQVSQDVANNYLTQFAFPTSIALPASKTFYISVDDSDFNWDGTTRDSISIVASGNDETTASAYQKVSFGGGGWVKTSDFWQYGNTGNPLDVSLFIFPYVSNSSDGCAILPVSLLNFGGTVKNYEALLNWSTASENNNNGFYIERSKDGRDFTSIGFVKGAGNSSKITNYNYTDNSLKDINVSTTYYRLKQVDADGKITYSKILPLNINNILPLKLYPNPVKDIATVEVNVETASKATVQVISRDGKVVLTSDKGIISSGTQQLFINTQNLAKGTYIVHVTIGDKTYSQLLVKE